MEEKFVDTMLYSRFLVENSSTSRLVATAIILAAMIQNYNFMITVAEPDYHFFNVRKIVGWLSPSRLLHFLGFGDILLCYVTISVTFIVFIAIDYTYLFLNRHNSIKKTYFLSKVANMNIFHRTISFFNNTGFILLIYGFILELAIASQSCTKRLILGEYRVYSKMKASNDICEDIWYAGITILCILAALLAFFHAILIALFNTPKRILPNNALALSSTNLALIMVVEKTIYAIIGLIIKPKGWIRLLFQLMVLMIEGTKVYVWNKNIIFSNCKISKVFLLKSIFLSLIFMNAIWSQVLIFDSAYVKYLDTNYYFLVIFAMLLIAVKLTQKAETFLIKGILGSGGRKIKYNQILYIYSYLQDSDNGDGKISTNKKDENLSLIITVIRYHMIDCINPKCVCNAVRNSKKYYDSNTKTDIDFTIEENQRNYFINLMFIRELLVDQLTNSIKSVREKKKAVFALVIFYVFECKNVYKASELLKLYNSLDLTFIEKFELTNIKRAFTRYFTHDLHHKYNNSEYLIVEKFIALSKSYTSIQEGFVHLLRKYHSIIILFVSL